MAILFDADVTPDALTAFVREVPTPRDVTLFDAMPERTFDDHTIRVSEITKTNRTAKFRNWDGQLATVGRDGGSVSEITLLPMGITSNLGEYEQLQRLMSKTGGTNRQALVDAIYNDAQLLTEYMYNRLELAWGQVLSTGAISINENGVVQGLDFGVPAENRLDAATAWSNTAAPILDNLLAWVQAYEDTPGNGKAGAIRMKTKDFRNLQRNAQLVGLYTGEGSTRTRITAAEVRDVLAAEELPPIIELPDTSVDVDGVSTKILPDARVLITPANLGDLGFTALGVSVTGQELANSAKSELTWRDAAGLVGIVHKGEGVPFRQFTYVDAVAMPVLAEPKRLMIADVS